MLNGTGGALLAAADFLAKQKCDNVIITDLIEYMVEDGLSVGCLIAEDENETMGIDDLFALKKAQEIFRQTAAGRL